MQWQATLRTFELEGTGLSIAIACREPNAENPRNAGSMTKNLL